MAKRFTDSAKWKKEFIKGLSAKMKLMWFYILDDCDHAGIWEVDMEVASLRIGEKITYEEAFVALGEKIRPIGKWKWFIEDFIFFQYGELNPKNRMHQSVIGILNKHNIQIHKPLESPLEGAKDKDKDKDKVKDKDNKIESPKIENVEQKLLAALDEIYTDQQRIKWQHLDFDFELRSFAEKVRGSPDHYAEHDTGGIRLAFQAQLRHAKRKSPNGKNDRTQQNNNDLAIIAAHASGGGSPPR